MTLDIQEDTKIKVYPLTSLQMEKNMFFVIPEMPSKTFVMVLKKLPDHFKLLNFLDTCYGYDRFYGVTARPSRGLTSKLFMFNSFISLLIFSRHLFILDESKFFDKKTSPLTGLQM